MLFDFRHTFLFVLFTSLLAACTSIDSAVLIIEEVPDATVVAQRVPQRVLRIKEEERTPLPVATAAPTARPTAIPDHYRVQAGDTLLAIAAQHGITLEELMSMNGVIDESSLQIGQSLKVPARISLQLPARYLAHDSEVIYSPAYVGWDTRRFIASQGGYLAQYQEEEKDAAQIIDAVAAEYLVGPRVLLAAMELLSGWVTRAEPPSLYPFALEDPNRASLERQASWAAQKLMEGYYSHLEGRSDWVVLSNGSLARLSPGTNPGSAGVAALLATAVEPSLFMEMMESEAFQHTYERLFGTVDGGAILPPGGVQPDFDLPWKEGERWVFSGGPHGGYGDRRSGWAALDFAPPVKQGCQPSETPVRAVAPGLVVRSQEGELWVDMDGDRDLRTGWVLFYLHLATEGRVVSGTRVERGDPLGYPSCEGGHATGAHLHIARLYNGQWMPASGEIPFQLGDWTSAPPSGESYEGYLYHTSGLTLEACDCREEGKNIFPRR